jgi:hypothetical protein
MRSSRIDGATAVCQGMCAGAMCVSLPCLFGNHRHGPGDTTATRPCCQAHTP